VRKDRRGRQEGAGDKMSKLFPNNKDHIIDDMDEKFSLSLEEKEYDELRRLTERELFLVTLLLVRATRAVKEKAEDA